MDLPEILLRVVTRPGIADKGWLQEVLLIVVEDGFLRNIRLFHKLACRVISFFFHSVFPFAYQENTEVNILLNISTPYFEISDVL